VNVRRFALAFLAVLLFTASAAWAGVSETVLLGRWSGTMTITLGAETQSLKISMEFLKGGTVKLIEDASPTPEMGTWVITGENVLLPDPAKEGNDVLLKNVVIDPTHFAADMVPAQGGDLPPGASIKLAMMRQAP
jgi:hypothetical protein